MNEDKTSAEMLAALTVDKLIESGLLRADKRDALITKISAGNMLSADWKLEIDLASTKVKGT